MHHAYLIIGTRESAYTLLPDRARVSAEDCRVTSHDSFTIADARDLRYHASLAAFGSEGRIFVVAVQSITDEAQQALLKLFEDPADATTFYMIAPDEALFLPTFLSRCITWKADQQNDRPLAPPVSHFLNASYQDRFALIQELLVKKDVAGMETLFHGLETYAHDTHEVSPIHTVLTLAAFRFDRGVSLKMILEHLALSFPLTKKMR